MASEARKIDKPELPAVTRAVPVVSGAQAQHGHLFTFETSVSAIFDPVARFCS